MIKFHDSLTEFPEMGAIVEGPKMRESHVGCVIAMTRTSHVIAD